MNKPDILEYDLKRYLGKFHRYNDLMENFLMMEFFNNRKSFDFKKKVESLDLEDEEQEKEFLELSGKLSEQSIFYPQSFRTSYLVQIFTILEHNLNDLCEYHHYHLSTDFSVKDLKGNSDIDKCKLYLKKACKIEFNKLDPEWNFIESIRKIRNIIVHNKGELTSKHRHWNSIFQFINSNKELIGFSECIEYMEKDDFEEFHDDDLLYHLEISARKLNKELLENIEIFFQKLKQEIVFN